MYLEMVDYNCCQLWKKNRGRVKLIKRQATETEMEVWGQTGHKCSTFLQHRDEARQTREGAWLPSHRPQRNKGDKGDAGRETQTNNCRRCSHRGAAVYLTKGGEEDKAHRDWFQEICGFPSESLSLSLVASQDFPSPVNNTLINRKMFGGKPTGHEREKRATKPTAFIRVHSNSYEWENGT